MCEPARDGRQGVLRRHRVTAESPAGELGAGIGVTQPLRSRLATRVPPQPGPAKARSDSDSRQSLSAVAGHVLAEDDR